MKPNSVTDPAEIRKHIAKFKRRAKFITDQETIAQVLQRFSEQVRRDVFAECVRLLPIAATYPTPEQFRVAALSRHALVDEIRQRKEREREPAPVPPPPREPDPVPVPPRVRRRK